MGELRPGEVVDGRYEVLGFLGEGAWCRVYRARQRGLDREVALKVPSARLLADTTGLARFFREVLVASRLVHPNVVEVFDMKKAASPPYFSMQLVSGGDLREGFARRMPTDRSLVVLAGVARALGAAGAAGVVHRDLKPANVLISAEGEAKVTDWGLSKVLDGGTRLTATGNVPGTPMYMAPEQLGGREVGPPADWYALGVMVAEAVMVGAGWEPRDVLVTKATHMQGKLPPLDRLVPGVSPELAGLVAGLLSAEPASRPSDADEVAGVLIRAGSGVSRSFEVTGPAQPAPPLVAVEVGSEGPPVSRGSQVPGLVGALLLLGLVLGAVWYGQLGSRASTGLVVREARLLEPRLLELRFEGGGTAGTVQVAVRNPGGGAPTPVAVSLAGARDVSRRVRSVQVPLLVPIVEDAQVEVLPEGRQDPTVVEVSGRRLVDEVLAPVRSLAGEPLGRLLSALEGVRKKAGDGREAVAALLADAGLDATWCTVARRVLPSAVTPAAPPWLVRDLLPLRMMETQVEDCPWPHLAPLLGQRQDVVWPPNAPQGTVVVGARDTMINVPDFDGSPTSRRTFCWLLDEAEIAKSRSLRRAIVDVSLLDDGHVTSWRFLKPETVVEVSIEDLASVPASARLSLQLNVILLCREAYLEVAVNGHGDVVLMNWGLGRGVMTSPEGWSFPVERSWLVPGVNHLRVRARRLPGMCPYAAAGLAYVRIVRVSGQD